jgi:hypothetical protein
MSSPTLPTWGCLRDGELYALPTPEPATTGLDYSPLLLPTPAVNDMGAGKDPRAWDEWTERMRQLHQNGNGHGKSLEQEALRVGDSTRQRSTAGSVSLADLHQSLPFAETSEID